MNDKNQEKKNPFALMEEDVLDFWKKSKTFEKSVEKESPQGDYVFYDGPPFITGLPHYATLLPSIAKDMVPRYWTMKGYRVERVWGWDCHGLPAENKVEGELGLKNKKDIEELGIDKFVQACRDYVNTGSEQWEWYIDRIARWVDMKNAYKTMDLKFMESVIWAFKRLYEKDLIYEGYRSSLHCPRCATPLSKFEITMDAGSYKDVEDETVIVEFNLKKEEKTSLLAWTTTPWTLPGNLALAVGPDIDYVKIEKKDMGDGDLVKFILAKEKLEEVFKDDEYKIIKEFKGVELVGLEYESIFDLDNETVNNHDKTYRVYAAGFVSTEDGTGIVHIAPNFGEDDFNLGKENGLPIVDLMDESGVYTDEAGEWSGLYFKKANKKVLEVLGDKLFSSFKYTHSYPFCYRCGTSLIYKTQKAWYLRIEEIRNKMLELNKKINWVPGYFKEGRFQYNLESAPDWCLSRSRYWGSPIPVWRCTDCEEIKVLGSIEEIEELSGQKINDLHRPDIDKVVIKCGKCGKEMRRVPEVFDCWFESGAMPFAQFNYPFKREGEWNNLFPSDFIIEYTGQLRGWFYYLHVLAVALFDDVAFKNVIVSGVLAGTDGRKMSKSYGNYPDPKNTLHQYGADALRIYFMSSPIMLGGDMNLNEKDIQDALRKNVMLLWNVVKFYDMFTETKEIFDKEPQSENVLDKWILTSLNKLIVEVTRGMEDYDLPAASRPITQFIADLSTWYVRRSRDRFKGEDEADKQKAIEVTGYVLLQLSKTIAPILPFISEQVWQKVTGNNFEDENKSVHLERWPSFVKASEDKPEVLNSMEQVRKIVELGLAKRDEEGIKVRQPLGQLKINNYELKGEYKSLIVDELNVKEVVSQRGDGEITVELDTELTSELKQEGMKRELVRSINNMRKNARLTIRDRIEIKWESGEKELKEVVEKLGQEIAKETLAKEMIESASEDAKEIKINNFLVKLAIKKL